MPAVLDRLSRRRDRRRNADRATGALAGGAFVAGAWLFLDPHEGKRRRHVTRDRVAAVARRRKREAVRKTRYAEGVAQGMAARVTHSRHNGPEAVPDDVTLARKVETEIFRPADAPKGSVDVNVERGVVFLRGTLDEPDTADALAKAAGHVSGVRGVKNLIQTR